MRLLLDAMCGGLRAYLRLCGHDAAFVLDHGVEADDAIAALARAVDRTVVTRDAELAAATDGIRLRERDPRAQLRELAAAGVDLTPTDDPERCGRCNGVLDPVSADEPTPDYAPAPGETPVWRCRDCEQCFWKGSQYDSMCETLADVGAYGHSIRRAKRGSSPTVKRGGSATAMRSRVVGLFRPCFSRSGRTKGTRETRRRKSG